MKILFSNHLFVALGLAGLLLQILPVSCARAADLSQQAYLKASNNEQFDHFGNVVAISGDTVVVGAHDECGGATGINGNGSTNGANFSGAAYVFVRDGANWIQQAYLKASNTGAGDQFGYSVAVAGDTVVIGALAEASNAAGVNGDQSNNSAANSGAAYVFVRNGTNWTQQAYLKASNPEGPDGFGVSVSISGDFIVVGAAGESSNAQGINGDQTNNFSFASGAAYVFVRSGNDWSQQAYLKPSNTTNGISFGSSVAVAGDTVVVGAPNERGAATGVNGDQTDSQISQPGAAYVFVRNGVNWSQQAYLKASNTGAGDQFGYSVSVSGNTVVVGAYGEDSSATGINGNQNNDLADFSGAAYVFTRSGANWSQQAYLKASNTGASDQFGYSVSVSGDTALVGAIRESSSATGIDGSQTNNLASSSGAAYIFTRNGVDWTQQHFLKSSNSTGGRFFRQECRGIRKRHGDRCRWPGRQHRFRRGLRFWSAVRSVAAADYHSTDQRDRICRRCRRVYGSGDWHRPVELSVAKR